MSLAKIEKARKIKTFTLDGEENGFLVELHKEGDKTVSYLTTVKKGMFKGYHLHRTKSARYVCIKGKVNVILYKHKKREEYILDAIHPTRLFIPNNVATGILNIGKEDSWIINYPDSPFDPNMQGEQVEYKEEELVKGVVK